MTCDVLLISGSLRQASTNMAVLRTAHDVAPLSVTARHYRSMAELPYFNPDDDREPLHSLVVALRRAIDTANALLFCTPEYAGGLPGSFKNLLDWTVGGIEMNGKAVAWINTASRAAPTGGEDAHASLRKVMGYVGARIVEPACIRIPLSQRDVDQRGVIRCDGIRGAIAASLTALAHNIGT